MKTHDVDNLWDNLMDEYFFCKSLRRATEWSYRKVLSGFRKFVGFHRTPDSIVRRDVQEWRRFVLKDQGLTSHTWNNKGKRTARAVLTGMCYSAGSLAGQPYKGRNGRVEGTRELVIHPHFVLVYEVDSQWGKVYILRVLHTAQKWP